MQNGKVVPAKAAAAPAAAAPAIKSDLDFLVQIERGMRSVSNLIQDFHAGAVAWANRAAELEAELNQAKAEIERLKTQLEKKG